MFDLKALIREVIESSESPEVDPNVKVALDKIKPKDIRAALEQALPAFVYDVLRKSSLNGPAGQPEFDTQPLHAGRAPAQGQSWRQRARLSGFGHILGISYESAPGERSFLADMGPAELRFAEQLRRSQAEDSVAKAEWFAHAAKTVTAAKVKTVAQLPPEVLAELLRRH